MNMLETHAAALESSNVAYHEFLYYYRTNEQIVYGFVEGKEDPSFYRGFIESRLPDRWEIKLIPSGNKDKVLKAFDKMDWSRFPRKRVCFFIDRDLSDFLGGVTHSAENLYITDNYSIENEAVNFKTMSRVMEEVFNVFVINPTEITSIRDLFESNLGMFRETMAPVMAQILLWRRSRANVSLDNIRPKEFFNLASGQISLRPKYILPGCRVQYAASCVKVPQADDSEIAKVEAEFRAKQGLEKYIRGKYLLWFFIHCAKAIHQAAPSLCTKYQRPPKIHIELSVENGLIIIAPRVRCPKSLESFIENNFITYIKNAAITLQPSTESRIGKAPSLRP